MMKTLIGILMVFSAALVSMPAASQSACPSIYSGAILTSAQWNNCFSRKQDTLGFVPFNASGGNFQGRIGFVGAAPTISSCGDSPNVIGNDQGGTITTGTGTPTACTLIFSSPWTNEPRCLVIWREKLASMSYTVTATAISISQSAANSAKIDYFCFNVQ